ncbi:hypothetical protein OG760_20790 [Streptomyces sp. NBC_00963]|uniref:hypothetical protein n=1 Tax=Streptomyces sp. NBC_00963 TaxID=2903697 RepID=UPI003867ED22|nr:hypothetical protein OG760_20790 [Streptomyces sp. NBC_00963]
MPNRPAEMGPAGLHAAGVVEPAALLLPWPARAPASHATALSFTPIQEALLG